jgi:hypothetical protein
MEHLTAYFDNYLENELSPDEKMDFETRLMTDKAFKHDFEVHQALRQALRRLYLKERVAAATANQPLPKASASKAIWWVCSGILLAIGLIYKLLNNKPLEVKSVKPPVVDTILNKAQASVPTSPEKAKSSEKLVEIEQNRLKIEETRRKMKPQERVFKPIDTIRSQSTITPAPAIVTPLPVGYVAKDFALQEVIQDPPPRFSEWERGYANGEVLKSASKEHPDPEFNYFYAYKLMKDGNPKVALPLLKQLVANGYENHQRAEWYIVLCQILLGESSEIIQKSLEPILENSAHAFQEKAIQLKKRFH